MATRPSTARLCTGCDKPHLTTDWYKIQPLHPRQGEYECAPAHEKRVLRETRSRCDLPTMDRFGHVASIVSLNRRVRYVGPGFETPVSE